MDFVKEFATSLHEIGGIKFGDFTLASGKKSPYYVDLRIIPSYPHSFRKMIKALQNAISEKIGLENFDSIVSVPTGGLVIASALAIETVKPLIYVRNKPKDYGTTKSIEGKTSQGLKVLMIDDVATTGGSVINGIKILRDEELQVDDAFVIVDRQEGAAKSLQDIKVNFHSLTNIVEITTCLNEMKLVDDEILENVKKQIS